MLSTTRLLPLAIATITQTQARRAKGAPGQPRRANPLGRRIDVDTRRLAVAAIGGYQRYLSPHKRFACAHRLLHGGESCSQYVKRAIAQQGLSAALSLARQRFQDCRTAHFTLKARQALAAAEADTENETEGENEVERKPGEKKRHHRQAHSQGAWMCDGGEVGNDCASECIDGGCELLAGQGHGTDCWPHREHHWPDCGLDDCDLADCDLTNWGDADCGSAGDCDPGDCGSGADCGSCDFG